VEYITDMKKLDAAIKAFGKKAAALDKEAQFIGLSALNAFQEHGNVFYINRLYLALGKGARHTAMTAWLLAYGGVKANTAEGKDMTPFVKDKDAVIDMESAAQNPWYDFKPSAKPDEVLDFYKLALALAKKKPKDGQEVAHEALHQQIAALIKNYEESVLAGGDGSTADDALAGVAQEA
jgi:hypothetical protein